MATAAAGCGRRRWWRRRGWRLGGGEGDGGGGGGGSGGEGCGGLGSDGGVDVTAMAAATILAAATVAAVATSVASSTLATAALATAAAAASLATASLAVADADAPPRRRRRRQRRRRRRQRRLTRARRFSYQADLYVLFPGNKGSVGLRATDLSRYPPLPGDLVTEPDTSRGEKKVAGAHKVVVVTDVACGCAASGLVVEGDTILAINGTPLTDEVQGRALARAAVGKVALLILRGGSAREHHSRQA